MTKYQRELVTWKISSSAILIQKDNVAVTRITSLIINVPLISFDKQYVNVQLFAMQKYTYSATEIPLQSFVPRFCDAITAMKIVRVFTQMTSPSSTPQK